MGLIRALLSSTSSSLGDQFKEYVTCPEVANDVIIQRGEVHHGSGNPGAQEGIQERKRQDFCSFALHKRPPS